MELLAEARFEGLYHRYLAHYLELSAQPIEMLFSVLLSPRPLKLVQQNDSQSQIGLD